MHRDGLQVQATLFRSSPAVRALLPLLVRLLWPAEADSESALPITMGTLASSLSQSRRPAYLMVTADSLSRSFTGWLSTVTAPQPAC
jgi:hypothetical protein